MPELEWLGYLFPEGRHSLSLGHQDQQMSPGCLSKTSPDCIFHVRRNFQILSIHYLQNVFVKGYVETNSMVNTLLLQFPQSFFNHILLKRRRYDSYTALHFSGSHAKRGALVFVGDVFAFNFFLSYLLIFYIDHRVTYNYSRGR